MKLPKFKDDFPILKEKINGEDLIYFDNAATSQIPQVVEQTMLDFNHHEHANVHRAIHTLGVEATQRYEAVRQQAAAFIGAKHASEIIFTAGCTDSLNMLAWSYGESNIKAGDEIVVSIMEHHSNLLPWQQLSRRKQAHLKFIEMTSDGRLNLDDARQKITPRTKILALTQVSNVLGTINPVKEVIKLAHQQGAVAVIDGAQAIGHFPVNVTNLNADFYAFSGHKVFAPTGTGILYGKKRLLEQMPPVRFGGEMIDHVTREGATWAPVPQKFEAGTPNFVGVIGLGKALAYVQKIGLDKIQQHEQELTAYALKKLATIPDLIIYGPKNTSYRTGVISFNLKGIHPHDVATALDLNGIEVRAGHHCAQPLMEDLGISATVRVSFAIYNTKAEIDKLVASLKQIRKFFDESR